MRCRLLLLCLFPMLASCYRAGPLHTVSGVEVEGDHLWLILDRYWERGFYDAHWSTRNEYYESALMQSGADGVLGASKPLLNCGGESAKFTAVGNTSKRVAVVAGGSWGKVLLINSEGESDTRIREIARFNPERHGYAVARSGRYMLLVTETEIVVKDIIDGTDVERSRESPLLLVREQINNSRLGRTGGVGTWWLSDDLRYVVIMGAEDWTGSDGKSVQVKGIGIDADLLVDAIVYDRQAGRFERCPRRVRIDMEDLWPPLVDVESIDGELLLLYGAMGPEKGTMAILDTAGAVRHHTRVESRHCSVIDFAWAREAGVVYLAVFAFQNTPVGTVFPEGRDVQVFRWDYRNGKTQSWSIASKQVKGAVENR
ncbi:MAG: hypothetical protein ACM359_11410 [Bacillota bacterium]